MKYFKIYLFFQFNILEYSYFACKLDSLCFLLVNYFPGVDSTRRHPIRMSTSRRAHSTCFFFVFFNSFFIYFPQKKLIYSHACCFCYLNVLFVICLSNKLWPRCFFSPFKFGAWNKKYFIGIVMSYDFARTLCLLPSWFCSLSLLWFGGGCLVMVMLNDTRNTHNP
jgi:hypothetical protein